MGALRKLGLTCNFDNDAAESVNARLKDLFVSGLAKKEITHYLLQQQALTIINVVTLATSFESADKTTELISHGTSKSEVNVVKFSARNKKLKENSKVTKKKPWVEYPECNIVVRKIIPKNNASK